MDTITGRIYSRILEAPHMKDFFSGAHYNFLLYRDRLNVPLTATTSATNIYKDETYRLEDIDAKRISLNPCRSTER